MLLTLLLATWAPSLALYLALLSLLELFGCISACRRLLAGGLSNSMSLLLCLVSIQVYSMVGLLIVNSSAFPLVNQLRTNTPVNSCDMVVQSSPSRSMTKMVV